MPVQRIQHAARAAALVALISLATGCGQDSPTAPGASDFSGRPILLPATERPAPTAFLSGEGPSVTVMVSAENGGVVTMGRYRLDFPAGALAQDTPITMTQTDPASMVLELLPHGIQFRKAVTLSARVNGLVDANAHAIGVAWHNDTTNEWEPISQSTPTAPQASASLWHFSGYSIFED